MALKRTQTSTYSWLRALIYSIRARKITLNENLIFLFWFWKIKNHNCGVARYEAGGRTGSPQPKSYKWSRIRASGNFFGIRNDLEFLLEQSNSNVPKWHVPSRNVHVAHVSEWWYTVRRRIGQSASSGNDGRTANTNPADSRGTRPRDQIIRVTNRIRQWQRWQRKAWFLILSRKFLFFTNQMKGILYNFKNHKKSWIVRWVFFISMLSLSLSNSSSSPSSNLIHSRTTQFAWICFQQDAISRYLLQRRAC